MHVTMSTTMSTAKNTSDEFDNENNSLLSGVLTRNQFYETVIGSEDLHINFTLGLNDTSPDKGYVSYAERPETYIVPVVFSLIFIVGLVGNGTLVHIFIKHRSMRNLPNTFILCLAVGDLLVILGTVPFISLIYTLESWPFGQFICKFSEFIRDLSIGVTVLTLSVLSFDRYLAIAMPFNRIKDNCSSRMTLTIVIIIWMVSVVFAIPGGLNSSVIQFNMSDNHSINVCYPFPQEYGSWYPKLIVGLKFVFFYTIPLSTIATFYAMMARKLVKSSRQVTGLNVSQTKHIELRTRVAKMVFTLAIIFAVCFFPNHIFMLWFYFTFPDSLENYNMFWHVFKISGYCLTFTNSCLNPVTLYLISGKFRSHFKRYLFGCAVKRRKGLVRTHTFKEGRPSNNSKPLLFYSTSIRSSSLNRQSTNSTRL